MELGFLRVGRISGIWILRVVTLGDQVVHTDLFYDWLLGGNLHIDNSPGQKPFFDNERQPLAPHALVLGHADP